MSVLVAAAVAVLAVVSAPMLGVWMADVQRLSIAAIGALAVLFTLLAVLLGRPAGVRTLVGAFGRWLYSSADEPAQAEMKSASDMASCS